MYCSTHGNKKYGVLSLRVGKEIPALTRSNLGPLSEDQHDLRAHHQRLQKLIFQRRLPPKSIATSILSSCIDLSEETWRSY